METKTPEQIQKNVSAAFDSVTLINKLVLETVDDKKKTNVERNIQHLELMLTKEFFTEALTTQQKKQINDCIEAGNTYTV
jgi:stress-induced morphogen